MRKAVITANIGDYDSIKSIAPENENWEHILITDESPEYIENSNWNIKNVYEILDKKTIHKAETPRKIAREIKLNLPFLFSDYNILVWCACFLEIRSNLDDIAKNYFGNNDIIIRKHLTRNCVWQESEAIKRLKLADFDTLDRQLAYYEEKDFPIEYGLSACNFIMIRNTEITKEFFKKWHDIWSRFSRRDQMSFPFVRFLFENDINIKRTEHNQFNIIEYMHNFPRNYGDEKIV
jgi:hypothetical protein